MKTIKENREFLKGGDWDAWDRTETDQRKKIPMPDLQKPYDQGATLIGLIAPEDMTVGRRSLFDIIQKRRSRRKFTEQALNLEELSYLLWATQGVNEKNQRLRTAPSGGARHPFETYLYVQRVDGLKAGLYRYLPLDHKLLLLSEDHNFAEQIADACCGQDFAGEGAVTFIWTTIPYRTEWRYDTLSHKVIALDAGHLCQNLYLACESINCGTCAIGAYDQEKIDALIHVDGQEEFTIYVAPVGKIE
ncbi:SagB-type dehydrogenase family enzyme [Anaerosolibacter carboniphilus]|uniref:SagB-type dehydrogenase family enzyme n=1 Tax=Anaerosolibacter carboniphilus TaxID=1417629 RepID=A0A841KP24_9FIRM|nr:SagB/ThcOx family dehydrogenase [Anaerosolibacter carboniphilus]MBB6215187.1 SagB-type dehydrogenase family enzyme [Anaerosolibacter carboniphilus]